MRLRDDYLNVVGEYYALREYICWAFDAGPAAHHSGDRAKALFYENLLITLREDVVVVHDEYVIYLEKAYGTVRLLHEELASKVRDSKAALKTQTNYLLPQGTLPEPVDVPSVTDTAQEVDADALRTIPQDEGFISALLADSPEYEIENILDCRATECQAEYLVKWKGRDSDQNSWEPMEKLKS